DEYKVLLQDLEKVEALKKLARPDRPLATVALQFVLAHPAVSTVIPGIKTVAQMESNLLPERLQPLSRTELDLIDSVVPPGGGRKIWPA
ncbi:MAG: aldo/keto reductase, partial [Termitinemataceae bacterium]